MSNERRDFYRESIEYIADTVSDGATADAETILYDAINTMEDETPDFVMLVLDFASLDAKEGALEQGDGLSQRVCDWTKEIVAEDVRKYLEGV
jgi:hypothetical protein